MLDKLARATPRPPDYDHRRAMLQMFVGLLHMYEGRFDQAPSWFEKAVNENPDIPRERTLPGANEVVRLGSGRP